MWRHLFQILTTLSIYGLYSIFLFTSKIELSNYILISNLIGFCFVISFIIEIKSGYFLKKEYFKAFSIDHLQLSLQRIAMFYKKNYLWLVIITAPLILLFINDISISSKVMYFGLAIIQNLFTAYLFISLYDFVEEKGYEGHINVLPATLIIVIIFLRNNNKTELLYLNPFGGLINLPIINSSLIAYIVPSFLFIALYIFNRFYMHKKWIEK